MALRLGGERQRCRAIIRKIEVDRLKGLVIAVQLGGIRPKWIDRTTRSRVAGDLRVPDGPPCGAKRPRFKIL